jgi:hypothetical protein
MTRTTTPAGQQTPALRTPAHEPSGARTRSRT